MFILPPDWMSQSPVGHLMSGCQNPTPMLYAPPPVGPDSLRFEYGILTN